MRRLRRRADGDRGATLVEFALITPLLFLLLGSMLDIGLAVLGSSVASNAAREGARVGIINFENAHLPADPLGNYNAIKAAVDAKLVGLVDPDTSAPPYVQVRCLNGITKAPLGGTGTCARSAVTVDRDLIEVTVKWTSVAPAGGIFTPDSYDDYARMVIIGNGGGGGTACVGSGGNISFSSPTYSQTEGNGPANAVATLTVNRSGSACTTTVGYATAPGSASAGTDYVSVTSLVTFLAGETTKTFTVEIVGDTVPEPNESFTVTLSNPVNGVITSGTATVTITNDDISAVPPALTQLRQYDLDADGRLDRITATFDEDLQPSCPTPGAFTFPTNTNGVSTPVVTFTGLRDVQVNLTEGPTADTSATALTVALAAGCVRDVDGNSATFGATSPTDLAPPVLLTVVDDDTANNAANGTFQQNDWVDFTFSEPLDTATLASATGNVVLRDPPGNNPDTVQIANVLNGENALPNNAYLGSNNTTATFANATLAFSNGNRTLRVTLANACTGSCGANLTQGGQGNMTFVFVTTLRALDGLPISSGPISVRLF